MTTILPNTVAYRTAFTNGNAPFDSHYFEFTAPLGLFLLENEMEIKPDKLITRKQVLSLVGFGATKVYNLEKTGRFPKQIPKPKNASHKYPSRWSENDVFLYIELQKRGIEWDTLEHEEFLLLINQ